MQRLRLPVLMTLAAIVGACQGEEKPHEDTSKMAAANGHGKLLSVNQVLGTGTLEIDGETVNFWWQNKIRRPATDAGVGTSLEMMEYDIPFAARVGDTIYFRGLRTNGEIFITSATTVRK